MNLKKLLILCIIALVPSKILFAQGIIKGTIIEKTSGNSLEFANIILKSSKDTTYIKGTITDKNGYFEFNGLPYGIYLITYSFIGFDKIEIPAITIDSKQNKINLGKLYISETSKSLSEVEIVAQKSTFVNSIDRKTFNVGQDLMSKTGSVSDLMQNIPSVQVDIDGNVSLRGSDNVTILINGRPSALMGANRAAVLQQMPANTIEKIEIITNPSAKYKPDGTSGIINIVTKKNRSLGLNGSVSANAGNDSRYNGNILLNYNPGKLNVFGIYSIRQDDRIRYSDVYRERTNGNPDSINYYNLHASDKSRPLSHIVRSGFDYRVTDHDKFGVSSSYNYRSFTRKTIETNTYHDAGFVATKSYDRLRTDPEYEKDLEFSAYFQHSFKKEGHELNADFSTSKTIEQENNHYSNVYRIPPQETTFDNTLIKQGDNESQFSLEYANPINEDITFEAGYTFERAQNDLNFFGESFNSFSNNWENDLEKNNHFIYTEQIHVLYTTYEQSLGNFGILAGLRAEQANVNSNQVTIDTTIKNNYFRLYPSLHLSYELTDEHILQLSYSHRINRPDGDEMNPFPEYQDPYNLRIGNPHLKPSDIHSIEMGYQFQKNKTNFLSTFYCRYAYNGMTDVVRFINDTVKLTTKENLSKSTSAGLELIFSTHLGKWANFNISTNIFYNTIDASNIGYSKNKSIFAWSANFNCGINLTKSTVMQITSNYQAERLTPQGRKLPSFVLNAGLKQELFKKKGAFILTVSDLFNTMRDNTLLETSQIYEKANRKRSARMIYAGFTYTFGNNSKKEKDNSLKFDNQL